ncbi:MAG: M20/M25/M40 family metallo-hydrolase [Sphingomonas bacterium]|nr:M20/M25/M40 family metallo-hydrolase [Sphingomonas bacterium]
MALLVLAGCATVQPPLQTPAITELALRATIATLSSDAFEGRMAGTAGEAETIAYIADRFRAAGLTSGGRGATPYLDPFAIIAKPAAKPNPNVPPVQAEFLAHMARLGNFTSHNVIGVARGRHPDGRAVVLMAHWDHLGVCAPKAADKICNGAVDNASGVAAMIAVAEQVAAMRLDRDVWFVATSAEEWGLLGARAFADKPPLPLTSIIAGFNLDTIAIAATGARVAMVAPPNSRIERFIKSAATALGRVWDGDHEADNFLRRQDGWVLAEREVPMVMAGGSFSDRDLLRRFLAGDYHGPNDELRADTDLGGAVDDANLHVELIRRAASRKFSPPTIKAPQLGH